MSDLVRRAATCSPVPASPQHALPTNPSLSLCAGLDTAYPLFGNAQPAGRLDAGDAILVDTIHTCGGSVGFREPYGHVDFFPNGGDRPQPGCDDEITGELMHSQRGECIISNLLLHCRSDGRAVCCMNCLLPLEHWGRWFESHSRHGWLCGLFCVSAVLCVGSGLATAWSTVQGVLPTV
jgi:hypothetical protein